MDTTSEWSLGCPRCAWRGTPTATIDPCPRCVADGISIVPELGTTRPVFDPLPHGAAPSGLWRWPSLLPGPVTPVSLGEGSTPLVPSSAGYPGLGPDVLVKDERANPTTTFKDRMAATAVAYAREQGFDTVAVASSGNAAVSTAAYAAAAGLGCVVLGTDGSWSSAAVAPALRRIGADVRLAGSYLDRWRLLERGVRDDGWFPVSNYRVPPLGSHPAGVRGYRTIAYEVAEELGWSVPDWFVLPVSRGDALCGVAAGFRDLLAAGRTSRVPRMLAVVRFPSLRDAVRDGADQPGASEAPDVVEAVSISDPQATAAAALAVRSTDGDVLVVDDAGLGAERDTAAAAGWLVELSSAAAFAGVRALRRRGEPGRVVALVTARA